MSRYKKPERYRQILTMPNVTQLQHYRQGDHAGIRGNWHRIFGNGNPLTLELACGKGEYSLALASRCPDQNFIGIDIKGDRIWKGATRALSEKLLNVHFLRARIDHICNYFTDQEVSEIWIPFPDPYLRKSKKRKRLTHPVFLERYSRVMVPGGLVHLKTDSDLLYDFTMETLARHDIPIRHHIPDLSACESIPDYLDIRTYYEEQHRAAGRTIRYVCFQIHGIFNA